MMGAVRAGGIGSISICGAVAALKKVEHLDPESPGCIVLSSELGTVAFGGDVAVEVL